MFYLVIDLVSGIIMYTYGIWGGVPVANQMSFLGKTFLTKLTFMCRTVNHMHALNLVWKIIIENFNPQY